ncbi:hypothetical protein Q3G72_005558 [Acer saccharum]|nr:hypothetical protein Q3G72_005558 [Acer saccharum]
MQSTLGNQYYNKAGILEDVAGPTLLVMSCPRGPVRMACQGSWAGSGPVHGGHGADQVRHEGRARSVLKGAGPPDRPATARGSAGS